MLRAIQLVICWFLWSLKSGNVIHIEELHRYSAALRLTTLKTYKGYTVSL